MLIKLENGTPTGHPVDDYNFRTLFPGSSFPNYLTPQDVEPFGFGVYEYSQQPETGKYEKRVEAAPVKGANGVWYQQWDIVEMNEEEKSQADALQAQLIRAERSHKLLITDWTQLADSPLNPEAKAAWAFYRENLRMVPDQPGFPWNVQWPPQPA